jgi:hypothetical protein
MQLNIGKIVEKQENTEKQKLNLEKAAKRFDDAYLLLLDEIEELRDDLSDSYRTINSLVSKLHHYSGNP